MRDQQEWTGPLFSYMFTEDQDALRPSHAVGEAAGGQVFDGLDHASSLLCPKGRRQLILPEQRLLALLQQAVCCITPERLLIAQLDYNLLFRWFVGLNPEDPSGIRPRMASR